VQHIPFVILLSKDHFKGVVLQGIVESSASLHRGHRPNISFLIFVPALRPTVVAKSDEMMQRNQTLSSDVS